MAERSPPLGDSGAGLDPNSLLAKRLAWEAENPRPEALRNAERAIVVALRDGGFGRQSQVTRNDGFTIIAGDVEVRVDYRPEHRWALVSDEDPDEHEVCTMCGAQRNVYRRLADRATITGGWPREDCEAQR